MEKIIAVFCTNVKAQRNADVLKNKLNAIYPHAIINFDLEDCDNILRVESNKIITSQVISLLNKNGFDCVELQD